jgi:hypothetical protein
VATCWQRCDEEYVPEQRTSAVAATASYGFDNNWYTDSHAADLTGQLDKLTMHDAYNGTYQIHGANGAGMEISHIVTSIIPTPHRNFILNNVLHVPTVSKNLIFVHKFTLDNDVFIELYPSSFLIKDRKMRKVMQHGPCKGGIYPMPPPTSKFRKLVFNTIRFFVDHWHNCLGHPSHDIVLCVIQKIICLVLP